MISIARDLDEFDIAQEVRLSRQVHKGAFLLLEGQTDLDRFDNYVDKIECSPVNCYGKNNATGATQILSDEGFPGIVAVVDADFERMNGALTEHENIISSDSHDIDLDWVMTGSVLERYLRQVGDIEKIESIGGAAGVLTQLQAGLKSLSVLRWMNVTGVVHFRLDNLRLDRFFSQLDVDVDLLVEEVYYGRHRSDVQLASLSGQIRQFSQRAFDLAQLTNGHDLSTALGLCLQKDIGSRRSPQAWGSEVEIHLRLTFDDADFKATKVFADLVHWERDNRPYLLLDGRLKR